MTVTNKRAVITGLALAISLLMILPCIQPVAFAEASTSFLPASQFSIPTQNGTINFAVNGSYSSATLQDNEWVFTSLKLQNSTIAGNITISLVNSNMTIYSYRSGGFATASRTLRCTIQGQGSQTVNFGLNTTRSTHPSEWYITIPGPDKSTIFLAEKEGWILLPDNTISIYGITGNLSITHYSGFSVPDNSNVPFYEQHSIIIITTALVSVTVAIALAVKFRVRL